MPVFPGEDGRREGGAARIHKTIRYAEFSFVPPGTEYHVAQRTEIVLTDDMDGGPADETVTFGLGSVVYEVDLSKKNADRLSKAIAPYIEAGRKVSTGRPRRGTAAPVRHDQSAVREWARAQGIKVSDRGRIPADVVNRYNASH